MKIDYYNEQQKVLNALDALGLALAEMGYKWTKENRAMYEEAVRILGGSK